MLLPAGKPDADNLLKIAADALRGIVLADDADPRLHIEVREFT